MAHLKVTPNKIAPGFYLWNPWFQRIPCRSPLHPNLGSDGVIPTCFCFCGNPNPQKDGVEMVFLDHFAPHLVFWQLVNYLLKSFLWGLDSFGNTFRCLQEVFHGCLLFSQRCFHSALMVLFLLGSKTCLKFLAEVFTLPLPCGMFQILLNDVVNEFWF